MEGGISSGKASVMEMQKSMRGGKKPMRLSRGSKTVSSGA